MLRAGYNIYFILICQIDYTVKSVCLVFYINLVRRGFRFITQKLVRILQTCPLLERLPRDRASVTRPSSTRLLSTYWALDQILILQGMNIWRKEME